MVMLRARLLLLLVVLLLLLCSYSSPAASSQDCDEEVADGTTTLSFQFREDITVRCRNGVLKVEPGASRKRKVYCS